jgi:hypothetical protein
MFFYSIPILGASRKRRKSADDYWEHNPRGHNRKRRNLDTNSTYHAHDLRDNQRSGQWPTERPNSHRKQPMARKENWSVPVIQTPNRLNRNARRPVPILPQVETSVKISMAEETAPGICAQISQRSTGLNDFNCNASSSRDPTRQPPLLSSGSTDILPVPDWARPKPTQLTITEA